MKRIMVFGSISYDRTLHLPRLPEAGRGVMASSVTHSVGGKGANVSVAAARAGGLEPADQLELVLDREDGGFVLQPVARADFDDLYEPAHGVDRYRVRITHLPLA